MLLALIERDRLEISDLSLVAVTDGFLAYIREMSDPPPALLAEFAGIAARLLVLKSRSLLPRATVAEEETEVDVLAAQLREYQRAKQAAEVLRDRQRSGAQTFSRVRWAPDMPTRTVLTAPPITHLSRALRRTLSRVRPAPEIALMTPLVSISEMVDRLRAFLSHRGGRWLFREMVTGGDRSDTIAGFIALLALWRRGEVEVNQETLFGDIRVEMANVPVMVNAADD